MNEVCFQWFDGNIDSSSSLVQVGTHVYEDSVMKFNYSQGDNVDASLAKTQMVNVVFSITHKTSGN